MLYRKMGKTNVDVSALGFGCMRFPTTATGQIDEEKTAEMLKYAIDHGVNYIDTAYPYHGGESENVVGKILKNGYRDKVHLATKLPSWSVQKQEDMDRFLDEQLKKLQTDRIDFYMLHALTKDFWKIYKKLDVFSFLGKAISEGRIKHAGFSFHADGELFIEIVDGYDWDFCLMQYNYVDIEHQAGRKGLLHAAKKGLGVAIMEPLRGGSLCGNPSGIQKILNEAEVKRTPTDWALRWVLNHPQVSTVLSGMSSLDHVKENIKIAEEAEANSMTEKELSLIERCGKFYTEKIKVPCTQCGYCMPCPAGVNIPWGFTMYNNASIFENVEDVRQHYSSLFGNSKASQCVECGKCEEACPQHIKIIEELKNVADLLEK